MAEPARALSPSAFTAEVVRDVRLALAEVSHAYELAGRSLTDLGSSSDIADLMVAMLPSPSRWDDLIGPFYRTGQVCRLLGGISRQALADRRSRNRVIALETVEGDLVYPVFEFDGAGVLQGLPEILQLFTSDPDDDWTVAAWLVAPQISLGGGSVVAWLRSGRSVIPVVTAASAFAKRLSH